MYDIIKLIEKKSEEGQIGKKDAINIARIAYLKGQINTLIINNKYTEAHNLYEKMRELLSQI